ncbi:MAG TPA: GNAT family N-acetyltransferase [Thermomicrobiales bacterium]|jgi:GNAT superfamily N-acetyltransferase
MISPISTLIGDVFALIYRGAPNYEAHLWPDATLALSGDTGAYWLNTVVIGDGPHAEDRFRRAITTIRERSLPCWVMHDESLTARLAPIAHEAELQDGGTVPLMVYQPAPDSLHPTSGGELQIKRAEDASDLRDANRVTAAAFETPVEVVDRVWTPMLLEMPGLDFFLARRGDTTISAVMTVRHGSVIGIWAMGTLPEYQHQGAGRQLLDAALRHHLNLGAKTYYLAAFEAGKRLYDQTGFQTEAEIHLWIASDGGSH